MGRAASGPLTVHPTNPRYFADGEGRTVLLTGSHTWTVLQDAGRRFPPPAFDFDAWLAWQAGFGHTFFRMWTWEQARWAPWTRDDFFFDPLPFARTGPGPARDGRPRFDLTAYDERYFSRLRERVAKAGAAGVYVAVMLFHGWSVEFKTFSLEAGHNPWPGHPMHRDNNVNGIDGDPEGTGEGLRTHTLADPAILAIQRAYVRRVVETVNDLDNVLFEISNEDRASADGIAWQYAMVDEIHAFEAAGGRRRHPVLMTAPWPAPTTNEVLFAGPAEAVSPSDLKRNRTGGDDYIDDPPAADGRKVVVVDTDHLWGVGGDAAWVWRSVMRGLNPIFMDPSDGDFVVHGPFGADARPAMGVARRLADRVDLATLVPRPELSSSRFALGAADGGRLLAFRPPGERLTVDLSAWPGCYALAWIDPVTGETRPGDPVAGGSVAGLSPPFPGGAVVELARIAASDGPADGRSDQDTEQEERR